MKQRHGEKTLDSTLPRVESNFIAFRIYIKFVKITEPDSNSALIPVSFGSYSWERCSQVDEIKALNVTHCNPDTSYTKRKSFPVLDRIPNCWQIRYLSRGGIISRQKHSSQWFWRGAIFTSCFTRFFVLWESLMARKPWVITPLQKKSLASPLSLW